MIFRNIPLENRLHLSEKLVRFLSPVQEREKISARGALTIISGTFLLSAGAGLNVVAPFFLIDTVGQALNVSNLCGILLLFVVGYT